MPAFLHLTYVQTLPEGKRVQPEETEGVNPEREMGPFRPPPNTGRASLGLNPPKSLFLHHLVLATVLNVKGVGGKFTMMGVTHLDGVDKFLCDQLLQLTLGEGVKIPHAG